MLVNLSIKAVPGDVAQRLREQARRNHRSLQGELMAIIEQAASAPAGQASVAAAPSAAHDAALTPLLEPGGDLLTQIDADLGAATLAGGPWLSREAAHDRVALRESNGLKPAELPRPSTARAHRRVVSAKSAR